MSQIITKSAMLVALLRTKIGQKIPHDSPTVHSIASCENWLNVPTVCNY
jgi:hypothetical protein